MEIKLNQELLTRAECNALRGLAILGIALHNYCHWLNPIVKENEYQYFQHNVDWFAQVMNPPGEYFLLHILSYFGHYGVPIFLFLSAFGLERKYNGRPTPGLYVGREPANDNSDSQTTTSRMASPSLQGGSGRVFHWQFIRYHFLKLFKMMIVGFICFTFIDAITPGRWHYTVVQIVAQLGMFNNLLAEPDRNIWPGPYWYFGLMLQLYIIYRLLLYRRHWAWTVGLMAVCVVLQLFMDPESELINRYRYNFMGGMLPFGLGLLFARYGEKIILLNINGLGMMMSFVFCSILVISMSNNFYAWTFVPALICYASVYFIKLFHVFASVPAMGRVFRWLEWMGSISAALFVIHPVVRKVFIPISRSGDVYAGLLLYAIVCLGAAWLLRELMKKIPNPKMQS
ncbi:MAG: acyltransferase [Prevotella sp.]|nr:acyltransferase [Prevotella sp.]